MGKKTSISRIQARQVEKKVVPAIKLLSSYMFNTAPDTPLKDFHGYVVPAGEFTDASGRKWQIQCRAVCTKAEYTRDDQITPIIRKGAWLFKLRLFSKTVIDKIFKD